MSISLNANDVLALAERMVNAVSNTAVANSEQRFSREDQTSSEAFKRWFGDSKVVDEKEDVRLFNVIVRIGNEA